MTIEGHEQNVNNEIHQVNSAVQLLFVNLLVFTVGPIGHSLPSCRHYSLLRFGNSSTKCIAWMCNRQAKRVAYKSDEIEHSRRQQEAYGRRKPLRDLDDIQKEKRFKRDVINLLRSVRNRDEFIRSLRQLISRYEQRVASENYNRVLEAFDEYWRKKS